MLAKYTVRVTEVVSDPGQGGAGQCVRRAEQQRLPFAQPGAVTVHQDGAFITPLPKGTTVLRRFRTPGRLSIRSAAAKATVEITVLAVDAG